jgi:hypothetical protein
MTRPSCRPGCAAPEPLPPPSFPLPPPYRTANADLRATGIGIIWILTPKLACAASTVLCTTHSVPLTCLPACLSLPACPQDSGHSPSFSPALIDYFMLRSMSSVRLPYNAAHPIPVVGRLSPQEEAMLSMQQAKRTRTLDSDDWEDAKRRPGPLQLARHHLFANSQVGEWLGGWVGGQTWGDSSGCMACWASAAVAAAAAPVAGRAGRHLVVGENAQACSLR